MSCKILKMHFQVILFEVENIVYIKEEFFLFFKKPILIYVILTAFFCGILQLNITFTNIIRYYAIRYNFLIHILLQISSMNLLM